MPWAAPHYYSRMAVAPDNENEAYFLTASFSKSIDGGATLVQLCRRRGAGRRSSRHVDRSDQREPHDRRPRSGPLDFADRGRTWLRQRLPNAQMYHVTVDNEIPYNVSATSRTSRRIAARATAGSTKAVGAEAAEVDVAAFRAACGTRSAAARAAWPRPIRPTRTSSGPPRRARARSAASSCASTRTGGSSATSKCGRSSRTGPPTDVKYRFVWDAPLHISPHDHNTIYIGSQHVHQTTDGGQSWQVISPDLTLNDKSRSAEFRRADGRQHRRRVRGRRFTRIAESPKQAASSGPAPTTAWCR